MKVSNKIYILKNKSFTKLFPQWELIKVGVTNQLLDNRIMCLLGGLDINDWEWELLDTPLKDNDVRLRETYYKTHTLISAFERVVYGGRTYRPNMCIKLINPNMYKFLEKITNIKSKLNKSWGVTEWVIRPNLDWIQTEEQKIGFADRSLLIY